MSAPADGQERPAGSGGHDLDMRIANNTARLRSGKKKTKKHSICLEVIHNRPIKELRRQVERQYFWILQLELKEMFWPVYR